MKTQYFNPQFVNRPHWSDVAKTREAAARVAHGFENRYVSERARDLLLEDLQGNLSAEHKEERSRGEHLRGSK